MAGCSDRGENPLSVAEHHVGHLEDKIAHQKAIITEADRDDHPQVAARVRRVLVTYKESLRLAREHLRIERAAQGLQP